MAKMKNNSANDLVYNNVLWKSGHAIEINQTDVQDLIADGHEVVFEEEV